MAVIRRLNPQIVIKGKVQTAKLIPSGNLEEGLVGITDSGDILEYESGKFVKRIHLTDVMRKDFLNSQSMPIFKILERESELVLGMLYRLIKNKHIITDDE